MKYSIAGTIIDISCSFTTIEMPLYVAFQYSCSNAEADITVDICNDNIEKVYLDLVQCAHLTHLWKKIDKIYIMLFADRGMYLDESPVTRIWCLVGNASQKYWKLHIPHSADYSAEELKVEIENRPWLQRLFIAYCMNSNMAVLHGAFCNVNGEGCLFLGDSGVGKSTMCSILEREYHVYADDRIVIKSNNNQVWAYGTPWNIKNTKYCRNSEATVKKIYFLYHGNNIISDRIPEVEALKRIMKQILHSNLYHASELLMWKLVMAKILREHTTVYEFGFVPDNSCIKYIFGKNDE